MRILRRHKISGWRRHAVIRLRSEASAGRVLVTVSPSPARPFIVRPDFVFRAARVAVFVDGCFWHACPRHSNLPANNRAFWKQKLSANKRRDRLVTKTLLRHGWRVIRLWERDLQKENLFIHRLRRATQI
jgi:DNA mismatch endonuclease, patch repair protein